jgi:hypothetical protein
METASDAVFRVTDFGAVGDGTTLNTRAIQAALDAAAVKGGEVVVPPGTFLTGTIFLRSHTTLNLLHGATLLGSPRLEDYTAVRWGHHMDRTPWHLVMADNVEDITIKGPGRIDGNGPAFWEPTRPTEWHFWVCKWNRPSPMVEITHCRDVRLENVTLCNPAGWTLHLHDTTRAWIRGIRIDANLFGPNNDGIDMTGVRDVMISDCHVKSGDDAIALKTTVDSGPCENVTVTNCVLESNCAAFRIGYESREDFRYVTFSNSVIKNCSRGIDLLSFEGSIIEHVAISNIVGTTNCGWPLNRAIEVCLHNELIDWHVRPEHSRYRFEWPPCKRGAIRHVTMSNVDFTTEGRVLIGAQAGQELRDISIQGLRLRYPMIEDPARFPFKKGTSVSFFKLCDEIRPARGAIALQNVSDFRLRDLRIEWPTYPVPETWTLLRSPFRSLNPFFVGNEEAIRTGKLVAPLSVLWARGVHGGGIELGGNAASVAGVPPFVLEDATVPVAP